jgi:hypothetical protein
MRPLVIALAVLVGPPDDGCLASLDGGPPDDARRRAALELWIDDCADCHGLAGARDGRLSASLDPPPPDLSDPCRPVERAWTRRVIVEGGAGHFGNAAMRSHHELEADTEVLEALVAIVHEFRSGRPCDGKLIRPEPIPDVVD